ncbi:MAG: cbb3-type cytochrome c oxidase subunit 3 [Rhodospirillales bacterium]|nr:cbb3-type cytochrome c oxidase subunit 3 [Rhodospirillales bacterium]
MTYDEILLASRVAGLVLFIALFAAILVYVFRPGTKKKFDDHAQIPLKED